VVRLGNGKGGGVRSLVGKKKSGGTNRGETRGPKKLVLARSLSGNDGRPKKRGQDKGETEGNAPGGGKKTGRKAACPLPRLTKRGF